MDSTLRGPSSVNAAQSEATSDPVYNTLSEEASNDGGSATYFSLNQVI